MLPPISLRLSLTDRCNLRCRYCRPDAVMHTRPAADAPAPEIWLDRLRLLQQAAPIAKLRLTGGEPLLYPHLIDLLRGCRDLGIPDLALTTNGLGLARRAAALREAGLKRINISLDSLDPDTYRRLTGGDLQRVLDGIDAALAVGFPVKLNAVMLRGLNDHEAPDLLRYAADQGVVLRFLEMMPIGPAAADFDELYITGNELRDHLSRHVRLEPLPYTPGETSRDHRVLWPDGRESVCGLILPSSEPFCDGCDRLRLDAKGQLYGCLAQPDREALDAAFHAAREGNPAPLRQALHRAFAIKTRPQRFRDQQAMIGIGG